MNRLTLLTRALTAATLTLAAACDSEEPSFKSTTSTLPTSETADSVRADSLPAENPADRVGGASDEEAAADGGDIDADGVAETTPASSEVTDDEKDRFTNEIKTRNSQTVTIDSFLLPDIVAVHETVDNSSEPLKRQDTAQDLGAKRVVQTVVLDRSTYTRTFAKKPPLRYNDLQTIGHVGKAVDIFVTVDDSESFPAAAIERARDAIKRLTEQLYDTNWVLFIGGFEGVGGAYDKRRIAKGASLAQAYSDIDAALAAIFAQGSLGDERAFRSLNRLASDYAAQDRDDATKVYLLVTDAPNCKDRYNAESATCARTAGNNDHHTFLMTHNTNVPAHMRHMALFGAYYRQTDNAAVCGNADMVEAPAPGESLSLDSQYADLAARWQGLLYNGGAAVANPSWVGDLCLAAPNLAWLDSLAAATRDVASRRFRTATQPDTFAQDPGYNLTVLTQADAAVNAADFEIIQNRVVILKPALSGTFKARYHTLNDYRKTDYANLLDPQPEPGTVVLSWNGGSTTCVEAATFTGLAADVMCRHSGKSLYLRHMDFLPEVTPGQANLTVTATYENLVERIQEIAVTATSRILTATLAVTGYPAVATPLIAAATLTNVSADGKSLKVRFADFLPAGTYRIEFYDHGQTQKSFVLTTQAAGGPDNVLCYVPSEADSAGMDALGNLFVIPSDAEYPCALNVAQNRVSYEGLVPTAPATAVRELKVLYKGYVQAIGLVPLLYPPYDNVVALKVNGTPLSANEFDVENNQVLLDPPLAPGDGLTMDYEFRPPLTRCYLLSGKSFGTYGYRVWYGPPRHETEIAAATYAIEDGGAQGLKICLEASLPSYGKRLIVGYISDEK